MKDINKMTKAKDVIVASKANRECIYYISLFGVAFIAAVVLILVGYRNENAGLRIYSYVLAPIFAIGVGVATRVLYASVNSIYTKAGTLYIKRPLYTRRIPQDKIDSVTVAKYGEEGLTSLKIIYGEKTAKYSLIGVTREDAARLKKVNKI